MTDFSFALYTNSRGIFKRGYPTIACKLPAVLKAVKSLV